MIRYVWPLLLLMLLTACGGSSDQALPGEPAYELAAHNPLLCEQRGSGINYTALLDAPPCLRLSDYGLFVHAGEPRQQPVSPGMAYQLNSALFTDHARKYRFVFLPPDTEGLQPALYDAEHPFRFPVGTVLVKVFALPHNTHLDDPADERIAEVRLLIHRPQGWIGLPYVWNDRFQDAYFSSRGARIVHTLQHHQEIQTLNYSIPTYASCRTCHSQNQQMQPIGTVARHLNQGEPPSGQLWQWQQAGMLQGLPEQLADIPQAPDWRDTRVPLQQRAKAYLDINCAHCHNEHGSAALSGLRLEYHRQTLDYSHGVCNSAHGWRGGGFDIWPGRGQDSSLPLRMELTAPADRMPPIGRSIADTDAVALIREWINNLPAQDCASG